MAGRIAYLGNIVTQGLVLDLDAAIQGSYPKTGSLWTDISGNNNNGTLTNGPAYTGSDYGAIVFDGVDDYGIIPYNSVWNISSNLTINCWVLISSNTNYRGIFGAFTNNPYSGWAFNLSDGDTKWKFLVGYGSGNFKYISADSNYNLNQWYYLTGTISNNNVANLYVNGTLQTDNSTTPIIAPVNTPLNIGRFYSNTNNYYLNGKISSVSLYNRALSATEITQNFNALRGRYGI